jgi:hypothetical protein
MIRPHVTAFFASLLLSLACAPAGATTTHASAGFSGAQLSIIDLTPHDGHAANVTWAPYYSQLEVSGQADTDPMQTFKYRVGTGKGSDVVSLDINSGSGLAKRGTGMVDVSAQTVAPATSRDDRESSLSSVSQLSSSLTVAPHTAFTLTLQANIDLYSTSATSSKAAALLRAGLMDTGWNYVGYPTGEFFDELSAGHTAAGFYPQSAQDSQLLTFSYSNNSNDTQYLTFDAFVSAIATNGFETATPPPVPEPSSYAMLGVGLAVMGALARKRKQG